MKRILVLMLAGVFLLSSVVVAQADGVRLRATGVFDFAFGMIDSTFSNSANWSYGRGDSRMGRQSFRTITDGVPQAGYDQVYRPGNRTAKNDRFFARQRFRPQFQFIASEHLQALVQFEIGTLDWGMTSTNQRFVGGNMGAKGVNMSTRLAFVDWIIPNTRASVRMGIQGVALPATRIGSPILNGNQMGGITIATPINQNVSLTAFWMRPFDVARYHANDNNVTRSHSDNADFFGLVLPVRFQGGSFSPYVMYGRVGAGSGSIETYAKVGMSGGQFLKIAHGARGNGMAGSISAITNDLASVF